MCRRWQTIFVVAFLALTLRTAGGADPKLEVNPPIPTPDKSIVVSLQPDLNEMPAGITYTWTVTPAPASPPESKPFIKLSGAVDTKFEIKLERKDANGTQTFEKTVIVQPTNQIDLTADSPDATLNERLGQDLEELKKSTPEFAKVCTEIADAIEAGLANTTQLKDMENGVRRNVRKAIVGSGNMPSQTVRESWVDAYNNLVNGLGKDLETFAQKRDAYQLGIKLLREAATVPGANSSHPAAISDGALDGDKITDEIVNVLREKPLELFKLDTSFNRTCRSLITALEDLVQTTDPKKTKASDYMAKTKADVLEVIQQSKQSQVVKDRWRAAYNIFVERVDKSTTLDDTKSEDWEKALNILIAGLKKAIGVEASWVEELAENQNRRTGSTAGSTAAGTAGSVGGSSGYGNTIHGVITARQVQRIRNRAAISRARIQRIRGQ